MGKPLVIVESPAKAKTIGQFVGGEMTVMASIGHVVDLPSSGLCVDVDNDFALTYEVTKRDVIASLKEALKKASELYLATDADREGEAIAWHLKSQLKPKVPVKRMEFTKSPRAPFATRSRTRGRSTKAWSRRKKRGARSIASTATRSRRCSGARCAPGCRRGACSLRRCG